MATKSPFKLIYPGQISDAVQFEENDIDLNLLDQFADMFRNGDYEMEFTQQDAFICEATIEDSVMVVIVDISDKESYVVTGSFDQNEIEYELPYCEYWKHPYRETDNEESNIRELIAAYMDYVTLYPNRIQLVYL